MAKIPSSLLAGDRKGGEGRGREKSGKGRGREREEREGEDGRELAPLSEILHMPLTTVHTCGFYSSTLILHNINYK